MRKRLLAFILVLVTATAILLPASAGARDELKNTDPTKYYIELDLSSQFLTAYAKDDDGNYTRVVRRMLCTTGRTEVDELDPEDVATPTPSGIWKIGARERFGKFAAFSGEFARYWTQIVDGVYMHSIMFDKREVTALKQSPFRRLGNNGSHGCVRLYVEDAKWIYYYACPGTVINIRGSFEGNSGIAKRLKSEMSFEEYDAFQQTIYDGPEQANRTAWISVDEAPMRTGNGRNDRVIKRLAEGTQVEVLQEGDPWVKVAYDGREGYVKRVFVTYTKGVMESREDGYMLKDTVYMMSAPDDDSERLCKIPHDTSMEVLERNEETGWSKVQYFDLVGYIENRDIRVDWSTLFDTETVVIPKVEKEEEDD